MSLEDELKNFSPVGDTLLTVGVFDGVHCGHQKLLFELAGEAKKKHLSSGVITFTNHPQGHLGNTSAPALLTSNEDKIALIKRLNATFVASLDFSTELAHTSAREFCAILHKHLHMKGLVLGFDFAMGHNREGSLEKMELLGKEMGFTTAIVPPVIVDGNTVSSTAIRHLISEGKVKQAANMLGRNYSLKGLVVTGKKLGQKLGFPTANIPIDPAFSIPSEGIYATVAIIDGQRWASVTNIGTAPTFNRTDSLIEVHILDFDQPLYGKYLQVEFVERIRSELTFPSESALKNQIAKDIKKAKIILKKNTEDKS